MTNKRFYSFLFTAVTAIFTNCAKKGCTDACAWNYDDKATKDNGSCNVMKPKVTFWSDGNSHGYIDVRIDSNQNGTIDLGEYFGTLAFGYATEPACGIYNAVVVELEPGTYEYSATASGDATTWDGTFTLTGCACTLVQLVD